MTVQRNHGFFFLFFSNQGHLRRGAVVLDEVDEVHDRLRRRAAVVRIEKDDCPDCALVQMCRPGVVHCAANFSELHCFAARQLHGVRLDAGRGDGARQAPFLGRATLADRCKGYMRLDQS